MDLEQLQELAEKDLKINDTELDLESLKTPQLHNKYLKFLNQFKLLLSKSQTEYYKLRKEKCEKPGFIKLSEIIEGGNVIVSLSERALGRVASTDIKNPITGEIIIKKNEMIDELACDKIDASGVKMTNVYSVMTCSSKQGVCAMCYGRDLSRGKMVHVGEAIGMISAQSIGEPGTQLTMRTFHVGGTASIKQDSQIVTKTDGILKIINTNLIEDSKKNLIAMGRNTQISIEDEKGVQVAIYKVPYGSKLFFQNGDKVKKNSKICEWDPYTDRKSVV